MQGVSKKNFHMSGRPFPITLLFAVIKSTQTIKRGKLIEVAILQIAKSYEAGGAACLSVLTDSKFFQGSFDYLRDIRRSGVQCPLICKEFIVEAYQLVKARAYGADCVLLIAAVLPNKDLEALVKARLSARVI